MSAEKVKKNVHLHAAKTQGKTQTRITNPTAEQHAKKSSRHIRLSPAHVFSIGFLSIILFGSLLLMLPAASQSGNVTPFPDTLFTAVSATCVTGLTVVDTGIHWTLFGQIVILCMIQIGGLGFMSFALQLLGAFGKRISPRMRALAAQSFGLETVEGTQKFIRRILIGTAVIEGCGALLLMIRTIPMLGIGRGIFTGIFLSVSAFCNAGFDPLGGYATGAFSSLTELGADPLLLLVLSLLIILGASGFLVWNDIWEWLRSRKRISMYTRFVLTITVGLLGFGMLLIAVLEWNNPDTIGGLPIWQKLLHAFFQSVTPRTAGFDAIGQNAMLDVTKALCMLLMFIGGASGSTAGGAKISTVGVAFAAVWSTMRGRRDIRVMRRTVTNDTVRRALCIIGFLLAAIFICASLIAVWDGVSMEGALYECFSAFCTVGLSLGLTPTLGIASRVLLIVAMYMGRVGILTLSYVLLRRDREEESVRYPEAKLLIG
ncbi:MAG: Trk family potassium uptake protein [Clostridia bacterium]|nr:Trk family potassium uptake protein [Clostridia bacterium]